VIMASAPSIPKAGWEVKTLGEVCDFQGGSQPPKSTFINDSREGYIRLLQIRDFKSDKYITFIPESPKNRVCTEEDILIGRYGASVGQIHTGKAGAYNVALMKTIPDFDLLNRKFFYLYLNSHLFQSLLMNAADRAAQNGFSKNDISPFPVPLPPLAEQERIVGILDEAFEGIAAATAQAEKNLHNARELFQSVLQSTFSQKGDEWEEVNLLTLLERGWITSHLDGNHGSNYPRKAEFIEEGIPYISANCIKDETVDLSLAKYLSPERAASLRKGIAQDRDVLFAHNATVGPVAILRTEESKIILSTSLTYYRCNREFILPECLAHYMRSYGFKSQYLQIMEQSTRNQVPITKQREFFHLIPPLPTQQAIVEKLDALSEETKALEAIYERKQSALAELKQSLLQKAFAGEL